MGVSFRPKSTLINNSREESNISQNAVLKVINMTSKSGLVISIFLVVVSFVSAEIPADIKRCKAGDEACIASAATALLKSAADGRTDLGIPRFDPYETSKILINHSNQNRSVSLDLHLKNAVVKGLSQFIFNKAVGFVKDPTNGKFELYGDLPNLQVTGKYKVNGRVLQIPIDGDGDFNLIAENSKFAVKIKPKVVVREDGHSYIEIDKIKTRLEPKRVKIHIENLFPTNSELGKSINELLNENWQSAWDELSPSIIPVAEAVMKEIGQTLFNKLPYDEIYLPD